MIIAPDVRPQAGPRIVRLLKKKDQTKVSDTNNAIGTDDPDFAFPVVAGKAYAFVGRLFYTTGATEDFKFSFGANGAAAASGTANPQSCVRSVRPPGGSTSDGFGEGNQFATNGNVSMGGAAGSGYIYLTGWFTPRMSGMTFLRWAQNTSGATPTILRAGSYIEITEVDAQQKPGEQVMEPWICTCKTVTESRSLDGGTLVKDAELRVRLEANRRYAFRAFIAYVTDPTPDFKIAINAPASPVFLIGEARGITHGNAFNSYQITALASGAAWAAASGTGGGIEIHGLIELSIGGDLEIMWAQNTSNAALTSVLAGSTLEILPLPSGG